MKVEQLYQLHEILKSSDNEEEIDWECICHLTSNDVLTLTKAFQDKHQNTEVLLDFYLYIRNVSHSNWKDSLTHLQIDDVEGVITQEILQASSLGMAFNIREYFYDHPSIFQTKEEWLTYLRCMPQTVDAGEFYADNLHFLLSSYADEEERISLIRGVSKYCSSVERIQYFSHYTDLLFLSSNMLKTFLDLAALQYDFESSLSLISKWDDRQRQDHECNQTIAHAEDFLLSKPVDVPNLPLVFLRDDFVQYDHIIETVQNMLGTDMLHDYIDTEITNIVDRYFLRVKINEVLETKNQELINAFSLLLHEDYFDILFHSKLTQEEKIDRIDAIIPRISYPENAQVLAQMLLDIPFSAWMQIPVQSRRETLGYIYSRFPLYFGNSEIFDKNKEETYSIFGKLSVLSLETNQKFLSLLDSPSFLHDPKRNEVLEHLLSKEEEAGFDYIYNQYLLQDKTYQKSHKEKRIEEFQVELVTVLELLNLGYDIDAVLDGFESGEEITPKTLVRSMKYKESYES